MKEKCPCCGSKKIKIACNSLKDKSYFIDGEFSLITCENCGLKFIHPLLNEKNLAKYYPNKDYYSFKKKEWLNEVYHNLSARYYSKKSIFLNLVLFPLKSLFYTYHVKAQDKGKSLLEIGCGDGLKLKIYKKYGLKTTGLEPYGEKLTEKEKNLGISRENFKKAKYPKNKFDYILLKEVLEHIPEQKEILKKCREWLKPEGKLIITLPNTSSTWCRLFKENWFGYDIPRHLYNYNPRNSYFLLKKMKFNKIKIRTYDNPYMLVGSLKFYLISKTGKREHPLIYSSISKLFFTFISLFVTWMNHGSLMEIECSK